MGIYNNPTIGAIDLYDAIGLKVVFLLIGFYEVVIAIYSWVDGRNDK